MSKQFPILHGKKIKSIPWSLIEPHAAQAYRNHGQSLERLAERGGLAACEALAVLEDRKLSTIQVRPDDEDRLMAKVEAHVKLLSDVSRDAARWNKAVELHVVPKYVNVWKDDDGTEPDSLTVEEYLDGVIAGTIKP